MSKKKVLSISVIIILIIVIVIAAFAISKKGSNEEEEIVEEKIASVIEISDGSFFCTIVKKACLISLFDLSAFLFNFFSIHTVIIIFQKKATTVLN